MNFEQYFSESKWMQKAFKPETKGNLHKALEYAEDTTIPMEVLLKKQAILKRKSKGDKKLSSEDLKLQRMITSAINARSTK
jgi:hypothetical protein